MLLAWLGPVYAKKLVRAIGSEEPTNPEYANSVHPDPAEISGEQSGEQNIAENRQQRNDFVDAGRFL